MRIKEHVSTQYPMQHIFQTSRCLTMVPGLKIGLSTWSLELISVAVFDLLMHFLYFPHTETNKT